MCDHFILYFQMFGYHFPYDLTLSLSSYNSSWLLMTQVTKLHPYCQDHVTYIYVYIGPVSFAWAA